MRPLSSPNISVGRPDVKLHRMSSQRSLHVTLTGDRSGEYVVTEERSDGCLVIAPTTARRSEETARPRAPRAASAGLTRLRSRAPQARVTIPEALDGWGVALLEDELVAEFVLADIAGRTGFAAVTTRRFIFVAQTDTGPGVADEHLLSTVRHVELIRRGIRYKLRVAWDRSETLIGAEDRRA